MRTQFRMRNAECGMETAISRMTLRTLRAPHFALRTCRAFTMIEIALSLAIIGFALVAIIGVLPIGMNTQKVNREETVINQDSTVFMNAICNGARGVNDLTNYVMAITNSVTPLKPDMTPMGPPVIYGYTFNGCTPNITPPYPLTSGLRIIGLLSTPKYLSAQQSGWPTAVSNYVVAYVRSLSGPAREKFPQNNQSVQDLAFAYRMTSEIVPYGTNYFNPSWVDVSQPGLTASDFAARSNALMVVRNLQANLHDVRLVYLWPLFTKGQVGRSGQAFRTLVGGALVRTNEPGFNRPYQDLFFFEPRNYTNVYFTPTVSAP